MECFIYYLNLVIINKKGILIDQFNIKITRIYSQIILIK